MSDEVDFLPADKHESFLQDDSITLSSCSHSCPKYPKQQVSNIFAISPEKPGDEVDVLPADKYKRFLPGGSITLGVRSQACLKYRKQQVCNIFAISQGKIIRNNKFPISLQYLKKEVSDEVDFLHGDGQAFAKFPK